MLLKYALVHSLAMMIDAGELNIEMIVLGPAIAGS